MDRFNLPITLLAVGSIFFVLFDRFIALLAQTLVVIGALWWDQMHPKPSPWDGFGVRPEDR